MQERRRGATPYQTPLRGWESAWRYVAVIIYSLLAVSVAAANTASTNVWVIDVAIGVATIAALPLRRRWPLALAVLAVVGGIGSVTSLAAMLLIIMSVATRRRWREIAVVLLVVVATARFQKFAPVSVTYAGDSSVILDWVVKIIVFGGLTALFVGWGLYLGSRRELVWSLRDRAERLENEQQTVTQQARDAERAQIAREMHDVLAHRISQISMQAGAIAFRTDLNADQLRDAASELQHNAHAALIDLRGVLGVLRDPDTGAFLDAPQPRFSDIKTLIEQASADGQRVLPSVTVAGDVDDTIGRTLYRLTQECLTNARKHAPGAVLTIRITGSPETGIDFTADNPLPVHATVGESLPSSGLGLVGLTERAELAGGTLSATQTRRGFTVQCHLPWEHAPAPRPFELAR